MSKFATLSSGKIRTVGKIWGAHILWRIVPLHFYIREHRTNIIIGSDFYFQLLTSSTYTCFITIHYIYKVHTNKPQLHTCSYFKHTCRISLKFTHRSVYKNYVLKFVSYILYASIIYIHIYIENIKSRHVRYIFLNLYCRFWHMNEVLWDINAWVYILAILILNNAINLNIRLSYKECCATFLKNNW